MQVNIIKVHPMALTVSRILHAGYLFEYKGAQIMFDPIFENPFSRNCYAFPAVTFDLEKIKELKLDAVFISHYHDDHCSLESLNFLRRETPIYIFCLFDELFEMIRELGFTNVIPLEIDSPVSVEEFKITPRKALDEDVDSLFQICAGDLKVLNVVDSWIDPDTLNKLAKLSPWDMVLWPFQTMHELEVLNPSHAEASSEIPMEWTEQLQTLNPRYLVPSSCQFLMEPWSWYNHSFFPISYRDFAGYAAKILPQAEVLRLDPSEAVILDNETLNPSKPLPWVQNTGVKNVDYEFQKDIVPPPTSQIAMKFSSLTIEQMDSVLNFCRSRLVEIYNDLESVDGFFSKKRRTWKLRVYDSQGLANDFYYEIDLNKMRMVERPTAISWLSEIPAARLFGALFQGESLTSLYLRINDAVFEPEIEQEIKEADIMEDPLIRTLYTGIFGAYQREQLRRIKSTSLRQTEL